MVAAVQFCIAYVIVDALCLTLAVIIASNVSRDSGSETQVRYFFMLLTAFMVFALFDAVWAILVFSQLFEPSDVMLSVVNGINLTAVAFTAYFWLGFSLAYFESRVTNDRVLRIVTAIPAFLVIVFHIIGYYTGQNVIFQPDGEITYGVMHTVNVCVPMFYILAATSLAIHQYRIADTRTQRRTALVFIVFMVPPAGSAVFDMLVPDMPVAVAGTMLAIAFAMMSLQESRISSDALTGLNNRRRAEAFLEDGIRRATRDRPLYLFIADLNHFKDINDRYGHLEGDHALQLMATALRNVCSQVDAFAARWGGDEFVLIVVREMPHGPEAVTSLVRDELDRVVRDAHVQYELKCSVGYAKCDTPSADSERVIAEADQMLYEDKQIER